MSDMSKIRLTDEERNAIASLRRLAKRWPRSLTLASMDGSLVVFRTGDPVFDGDTNRGECVIADDFAGIPNEGGGW